MSKYESILDESLKLEDGMCKLWNNVGDALMFHDYGTDREENMLIMLQDALGHVIDRLTYFNEVIRREGGDSE